MSQYSAELELLYRPQMNVICRTIEFCIFGITILYVISAAYVIIKKSPQTMGHYKYLLLNQLLWNFFFDSIMILWQPVPIFNANNGKGNMFVMAYSNGIFRYHGPYSLYIIFAILFLVILGMAHSLYFNMVYRVVAVFYDSKIGLLFQEPLWLRRIFLGSLGIIILVFGWPLFFLLFYPKDINVLYNNSIKAMPAMKDVILLEPSTFGCDVPTCGISVYFLLGQEGIAVLTIFANIFIIGYIYSRRIRYLMTQTTMSQTTMNLNLMLMKALIVHLGIIAVFLVVPLTVLYAIMMLGNEKDNITLEVIMVVFSCHSLFDIPAMFFFITPYRKFIVGSLRSALRKVGLLKNDQVVMIQQVQSSMAINSSQIHSQNRA